MTAKLSTLHCDAPLDATAIAQLAAGLDPAPLSAEARAALKQRVLAQVAAPATAAQPVADPNSPTGGSAVVKANANLWVTLAPGIEVKPLRVDAASGSQTSLWRLAAGAVLPEHDHGAEEECLIVSGDMEWNGVRYGEGDFIVVREGFHHSTMHSPNGATLLIRGELQACLAHAFAGQA
jgi:anti-sigma factor ChrR (cupin superfamily)